MSSKMTDEVQRRVRIRVAALGHTTIKEFYREYVSAGGGRSYQWWWSLSESSSLSSLKEAAVALGVPISSLTNGDTSARVALITSGVNESNGRVQVNEA